MDAEIECVLVILEYRIELEAKEIIIACWNWSRHYGVSMPP